MLQVYLSVIQIVIELLSKMYNCNIFFAYLGRKHSTNMENQIKKKQFSRNNMVLNEMSAIKIDYLRIICPGKCFKPFYPIFYA